jgi:CubicO group peptidase (beta-lactamase class C family)
MRNLRSAVALGVLSFVLGSLAAAQDVGSLADEYLTTSSRQGRFSGVVLIAKGDKVLLRKGYGMANVEQNVPNTPEGVFLIGSITKMFTAFSILQLEERGLLSVKDPVSKYVPEIPASWNAVTLHHLLSHTSGIPDFASAAAYSNADDPMRVEAALKASAEKSLLSAPGEQFRYSNAGYILLGRVIEKVSGEPYEKYVKEKILDPAGMVNTAYDHSAVMVPNRVNGYRFDGEFLQNAKREEMSWTHSAGALHSTVDDLYRFDRALKSGKLFSSAITAKAWAPYMHWVAPPPFGTEADYGYGWMSGKDFDHAYVGHGGWVGGFVSQFKRYPQDDAVIILLSNIESANYLEITRDLSAILFGAKYQAPVLRKIVHPDPKVLARYVGDYRVGPLDVKVTMQDGRLYAFGTGQPNPFGMIAFSDTEFYFNDVASEMRFVVDEKGKVNLILRFDGKEMPASRVSN